MRSIVLKSRARNARNELVMLLLASLGAVAALTAAAVRQETTTSIGLGIEKALLIFAITSVALLASVLVWRAVRVARLLSKRSRDENAELRRALAMAESVIQSEPHILLYWDTEHTAHLVAQTLTNVAGLPVRREDILRFGQWLEPRSAAQLKDCLDTLFQTGKSFNIIVRTTAADHIEAEGRATTGRAILRLSEVAGYKRDLARIIDQHQWLARDIRSMRALLNAIPMPVWLKTRDGRITWINKAYVQAVDAESEDQVLSRQIELLDSRERQCALKSIATGQEFRQRMQIVVGAERKAHDIIMLPLGDTIVGTAMDVAAIATAQGELERQIMAYDRTLDHVATGVAMFDKDQQLKFHNEAFARLWPLDDEWLGSSPTASNVLDRLRERSLLPETPNYREWKSRILSANIAGAEFEDWWLLPDGRIIHVRAEQQPDNGVTFIFSDESEKLALESRYNALINVQRETLDSLKEGVAVFAMDGRLKLHNSSFASIWRLDRDNLNKAPFIDEIIADVAHVDDEKAAWGSIRDVVTSYLDTRQQRAGQMVRAEMSVVDYATTPLPDGGTLVTFADVTVSKRYERALVERNEALEVADRLKNQFIGHVSYELRTPLTNIIGFSDLLSNAIVGPLNDKQRGYLNHIASSSRTLLAIIDDILDLATIDAGALELRRDTINVANVIDAAIEGIRDRAASSSLTIDIGIEDGVQTFVADEQRVRQVLYNLLSNAVGFSHDGGTIRITCWHDTQATVFEVEDEGVGIPEDQQAQIFDRFVSHSQGSRHRGAGLGLSISRNLVELHGGTLDLHSTKGEGTRIRVRFPDAFAGSATVNTPSAEATGSNAPSGRLINAG
ncbi:MAG: PAS-domain containing protein [Hyphomicrobiaceae bacterium]|nr:PAS-domain containing protein [Hyphomicrobiaceae bacterium]